MSKTPVALIVAGSESVSEREVEDLLLDRWPDNKYELDLVVPVNKDLFTKTVETVVDWYSDDEHVIAVQEKGSSMTRRAAKLGEGTEEVDTFSDIFDPKEFDDWDEAFYLIAMPEDTEDPDYDLYAETVEKALAAGFPVLNLARGLDDVRLADEEEPEPEPEEKPKRRTRRKSEDTSEPEVEKPAKSKAQETVERLQKAEPKQADPRLEEVFNALQDASLYLSRTDEALQVYQSLDEPDYRPLTRKVRKALETLKDVLSDPDGTAEETTKPEEGKPAPKRGRGRPRQNFEVNEIFDEDEKEWIPRPKGRLAKGTHWRKRHSETDEVLEEGTV